MFLLMDRSLYVQYIVLLDTRILARRIGINFISFHLIVIHITTTPIKFLVPLPGSYGVFC